MNVLFAHKYWHIRGGVEQYFFKLRKTLERNEINVIPFSMQHIKNIPDAYDKYFANNVDFDASGVEKARNAIKFIYNHEARKKIGKLLNNIEIDVAHVRNIYHHLSPSILYEIKSRNIPIVMSVADYSLICPNYQLLRNGNICSLCKGAKFYHAVTNNCVKNSRMASVLSAFSMYLHELFGAYKNNVDLFICSSNFLKNKLNEFGISNEKLIHVPHFTDINVEVKTENNSEKYFIYFGRLSHEKGIDILIKAIKKIGATLHIVGSGPMEKYLKNLAFELNAKVYFTGFITGEKLQQLIIKSICSVIPSIWNEPFGLTIIESYAHGIPVIGSKVGGITELIKDGETGYRVMPGNVDNLAEIIEKLWKSPDLCSELGANARNIALEKYSPERHYKQIINVYKSLIKRNK